MKGICESNYNYYYCSYYCDGCTTIYYYYLLLLVPVLLQIRLLLLLLLLLYFLDLGPDSLQKSIGLFFQDRLEFLQEFRSCLAL